MKCLERRHLEARPVGYGMIGCRGYFIVWDDRQPMAPRITPFPTGQGCAYRMLARRRAHQRIAFPTANRYLRPMDFPPPQDVVPCMNQPGTKTAAITPASRTAGEPAKAASRLRELGVVLPKPPSPLGAYVETSIVGSLLFVSGTLPLVDRKLAVSGRIGRDLSVTQGQEATRLAALNALAAAAEHLGDLDKLKRLVKLTVLLATTEDFTEHAAVADGASNLFVQLFGPEAGHVRVVYGVYSMPVGTPVIVETIFEV